MNGTLVRLMANMGALEFINTELTKYKLYKMKPFLQAHILP